MKTVNVLTIMTLLFVISACNDEETIKEEDYIFLQRYCATVTVGGFVGLRERCFEVGDIVVGFKKPQGAITIRIAEHSPLNDGPPTNASYQEFLDVPSGYLELKK